MLKKKTKKLERPNTREKYVKEAFQALSKKCKERNSLIEKLEMSDVDMGELLGEDHNESSFVFPKQTLIENKTDMFWSLEFEPLDSTLSLMIGKTEKDLYENPWENQIVNTQENKPSILNFYKDFNDDGKIQEINLSLVLVSDVYYVFDSEKNVK